MTSNVGIIVNKGLRKASVASFEVESCNFEESKRRKPEVPQPPTCDESSPKLPNTNHASFNMHFGNNLLLIFVGFFYLSVLDSLLS